MHTPRPQSIHRPVILVVEDFEPLLRTIQDILERDSFDVFFARDADQAIRVADSCILPIHLLITKFYPRGMPGPDLAQRLRIHSPEMSVIYLAGNPLLALEIPDPAEVVSSMLPTPFSGKTLLSRINTMLALQTSDSGASLVVSGKS